MGRNNEDFAQGKGIPELMDDSMNLVNGFVSKYAPNASKRAAEARTERKDPRVFVEDKHVGFQNQDGNFMNFDEDTAAQKHFAAQGYNKGTAGEMLKTSKARTAESTKAGKSDNQRARKASKAKTAARESSRGQ